MELHFIFYCRVFTSEIFLFKKKDPGNSTSELYFYQGYAKFRIKKLSPIQLNHDFELATPRKKSNLNDKKGNLLNRNSKTVNSSLRNA